MAAQRATDRVDADSSTVSLAIPADPAFVGTVRYFAATVARHAGLPEERTDDLRLAVSEACAEAMEAGEAGSIRVALSLHSAGIAVEVTSSSLRPGGAAPLPEGSELVPIYRLQLIRALFPDAQSDQGSGTGVVRFTVPSAGPGEA